MTIFGTPVLELPLPLSLTPKPGSYQQSCSAVSQRQRIRQGTSWTMTTLSAVCFQQMVGQPPVAVHLPASLNDPKYCKGDIANVNGTLQCERMEEIKVLGRVIFALPGGSWRQTCRDAYYDGDSRVIRAECRMASGAWRYASLPTHSGCTSMSNDDGWLSCDSAPPLPRGPWRTHCTESSIPQADLPFAALCRRQSDNALLRTTISSGCTQPLDVLAGFLTCGLMTGAPSGDWPNRCVPINWDAMAPAITLICDQRSIAFRVPLETCPVPITLNYDGSGPMGFLC